MADKIILQIKGNIAEIKLNNAQKLNCMGFEMLEALDEAVVQVAANPAVRVLLFTGAGERAFSTGADLKEFKSLNAERAGRWIELGNLVFNKIETLPKPTVALVHGYVMGGGMELALACDFRLAKVNTILSAPELQHGWLPGWGGMTRLRRLIGEARAKEVVMLNERITAKEALRLGLLTRILQDGTEEKQLTQILTHLASLKPSVYRLAKAAIMDAGRTTSGPDIEFDILAMQEARQSDDAPKELNKGKKYE